MKQVIVIGAGLGGLAAACRLAKSGFKVTVLEKNEAGGGKVDLVEAKGYKFDTGASLLTMPHIFRELFEFCGRRLEDYLELIQLEPICRYFWSDGTTLDASTDLQKTENGIAEIEPRDAENFRKYLADAGQKYDIAERTFLARSLNDLPQLLRPAYLPDLLKISTLTTLDKHNARYFQSPKIRQLFNRFATYNGSSPYKIPATFSLIPFVEFNFGAWYVMGGIYEIPRALEKLARELGVEFRFEAEVKKIIVKKGKATGVRVIFEEFGEIFDEEILEADLIVSNSDAVVTYRDLIEETARPSFSDKKLEKREPSSSGFVLLLGVKKLFPQLAHHNIFFSDDYRTEFHRIFNLKIFASEPTIYVCASSKTAPSQAPAGCENLFVLVNAPYMAEITKWHIEAEPYRDLIIRKLENSGLEGLKDSIEFERVITPENYENIYNANRGSIYGISSNSVFSAFRRIPNKSKDIENLYFVGGSTHPGGGMPLVILSGKMTSEMILRENFKG